MLGDGSQQRIDCLLLNLVRWIPGKPLGGQMFRQSQPGFFVQIAQEVADPLVKNLVRMVRIADGII